MIYPYHRESGRFLYVARVGSLASAVFLLLCGCGENSRPRRYAGSASCRECHERFYELWAPSHHGKALQPWSAALAGDIPPQQEPLEADGRLYQAVITPEKGWVQDDEGREYVIAYAMGGKNYYNFLTLLEDGRLQVLPIFYDVQQKAWRNTTRSMLRHFSDGREDTPIHWRDPMLTFNAACFGCHVSQIESNYDPETDSYATTWNEPGISCESCHGPASEHNRLCRATPKGTKPKDLAIISWKDLTVEQQNDACSACHAKAGPITARFETGNRFWDHYDLTTFEDPDYYPNGRDLGENYTLGSWLLSPCVKNGNLSCTYCHTSSGRYRFKTESPNKACLPCHQERVENAAAHMHHPKGGATTCVDCHMAMHSFGGMNQSDHSMRPPMPNLSIAVGSRNACVICHTDKSNEWALEHIRSWHPGFDEHTKLEMQRALLVKELREGKMDKLPEVLEFIAKPESDPLFVTSLIRLLPPSHNARQHAVLRKLVTSGTHPLVRAAAATSLDADQIPGDRPALFVALSDDYRLVRVRTAERLAALSESDVPECFRKPLAAATVEMWAAYNLRLDNWASHFNTGNILMRQGRLREAAAKYDRAHELRSDVAPPLINSAMAFANLKDLKNAEKRLLEATKLPEPSSEAHFNLGLLYAEQGRRKAAERALYRALELAPQNATAACNLAILKADEDLSETFRLLKLAIKADPRNARYVHTLAYYYMNNRDFTLAREVIQQAYDRGLRTPELRALQRELMNRQVRTPRHKSR